MKKLVFTFLTLVIGVGSAYSQSQDFSLGKDASNVKATVYFLRSREFPSSRFNPIVFSNKVELARIASGSYFRAKLDAGDYTFSVDDSNLPLTLKSGETYYIQVEMKFGLFKGKGHPIFIDQQLGATVIKQAKYIKPLKSKMILNHTIVVNDEKKK